MEKNLKELFKEKKFEELEAKLKKMYPQIDTIEWNADNDEDVDLHIVFVKLPYMLPFSGASYAHFGDLDDSTYGTGLEKIMEECRPIKRADLRNIDIGNYLSHLKELVGEEEADRMYTENDRDDFEEVIRECLDDTIGSHTLYSVVDAKGKDCIYEGYDYSIASKMQHGYNECCGDWYLEELDF